MKKITTCIVSLILLISMVLSAAELSFADESIPENEENVIDIVEEPTILETDLETEVQQTTLPQETRDAAQNVVTDEVLRKVINKKLGLGSNNTADVTQAQVESLTGQLKYNGYNKEKVTSLEGLQYAINLENLDLRNNQISNLNPLSTAKSLVSVNLGGNAISDITGISTLSNLNTLYLAKNSISNISDLSNLTKLKILSVKENQISDIAALSGLVNLERLYLSYNSISDISALSDLTKLKTLSLKENQIKDISALSELVNLEQLYLSKNRVSDITSLSELLKLKKLYLGENKISDISTVSKLSALTHFDCSDQTIEQVISPPHTFSSMIINVDENLVPLENPQNGIVNGDGTYSFSPGYSEAKFDWNDVDGNGNPTRFSGTLTVLKGFDITSTSEGNGAITPMGTVVIKSGTSQTFDFTPDSGYEVDKVIVDDVEQPVSDSYTFNNVTENHTIKVIFKQITHTVTATAGANGSITPSGDVAVTHGSNKTFTITPAAGYKIKDVTVDGVSQGTINILTLENIAADQTVKAIFEEDPVSITGGADQSMVEGSDTIEEIKLSGKLEQFEGLWVNGTKLIKGIDYTAEGELTVVTFASDYLKKLEVGTYNLEFRYTGNRVATTTLEVTAKENNNGSNSDNSGSPENPNTDNEKVSNSTDRGATAPMAPNTGDSYPIGIAIIAFVSMMALVVIKKKYNG